MSVSRVKGVKLGQGKKGEGNHLGFKVLNKRRHGLLNLAVFHFDFRVRRGYPKKVTKEFLLVDLLDNIKEAEDGTPIQEKLLLTAKLFGNCSTEKLLADLLKT